MLQELIRLSAENFSKSFIFCILLNGIIMRSVISIILLMITDGNYEYILGYLLLVFIRSIFENFIVDPWIITVSNQIKQQFDYDSIYRYNCLATKSKNIMSSSLFQTTKECAKKAIYQSISWGLFTLIEVMGISCGIIMIAIYKKLYTEYLAILVINILMYIFIIQPKQTKFVSNNKNRENLIQCIEAGLKFNLYRFQYDKIDDANIINQSYEINEENKKCDLEWKNIIGFINVNNNFISAIISYFVSSDIQTFLLMIITTHQLSFIVRTMSVFATLYNNMNNDYDKFDKLWLGPELKNKCHLDNLLPNDSLFIFDININMGKFMLKNKCGNISLGPNQKIYIGGHTGDSKSIFAKALIGLIPGVTMNIGKPENYYHYVVNHFRDIEENFSQYNITIRKYFNEANNDTIDQYMWVFSWAELQKMKSIITQSGKHFYDSVIQDKMSYSQKSRLMLALCGYEIDIKKKGMVILDNVCPNIDNNTYIQVLNIFFNRYKNCIIVMIAHLCQCIKSKLSIEWTQELVINNDCITRVY